jgi:hypothetical protein
MVTLLWMRGGVWGGNRRRPEETRGDRKIGQEECESKGLRSTSITGREKNRRSLLIEANF